MRNGMACAADDSQCRAESYQLLTPSCANCLDAFSDAPHAMGASCFGVAGASALSLCGDFAMPWR